MAFYISLISTILWFIFMTYLSHQDGEHTGRASRELAEHLRFLDNDINDLNGKLRRAAHIVVFAVFTFLLGLTLKVGGISLGCMLVAAAWSYVDEATKPWIRLDDQPLCPDKAYHKSKATDSVLWHDNG